MLVLRFFRAPIQAKIKYFAQLSQYLLEIAAIFLRCAVKTWIINKMEENLRKLARAALLRGELHV